MNKWERNNNGIYRYGLFEILPFHDEFILLFLGTLVSIEKSLEDAKFKAERLSEDDEHKI